MKCCELTNNGKILSKNSMKTIKYYTTWWKMQVTTILENLLITLNTTFQFHLSFVKILEFRTLRDDIEDMMKIGY